MLSFFKRPYPLREAQKKDIVLPLCVGVFVGAFLIIFKPFGLHNLPGVSNTKKILGYGLISFLVSYFYMSLLPSTLLKYIEEKNWNIGKEILYYNLIILTIAICNSIYSYIAFPSTFDYSLRYLFSMALNTLLVGIFPCTFIVIFEHNKLFKRNVQDSQAIKLPEIEAHKKQNTSITINVENEDISIISDDLLYIESVGNYAKIIRYVNNNTKSHLVRTTMKNIENQLTSDAIIRCHRSYIINLDKVTDVNGNAQGFKLSLPQTAETVPVSRKFVPIVKEYFAKANPTV